MNDPKGGVAKVTCPTFEAMGQIPAFHRTYFLFIICLVLHSHLTCGCVLQCVADRHWFQSADADTSSLEGTDNKRWTEEATICRAHQF